MAIRQLKPVTPASRFTSRPDFSDITTDKPEKSLVRKLKKTGGRNNKGRITSRRRGGGHKRSYRIIDFKRNKFDIEGKVATIEYDPNRSAFIALIHYVDGEKRYIIQPDGLKVGDKIISSEKAELKAGNAMQLKNIPSGQFVHNIEMIPGKGAQMARSAGAFVQVMAHDNNYVTVKMPSGEVRMVPDKCLATVGVVGNKQHELVRSGKAGRSRWLGRRPHTRGVVKNPVDHPHGGGEGKSAGGRHPVSPTGQSAKGLKTRDNKRTDKYIVRRRNKRKDTK